MGEARLYICPKCGHHWLEFCDSDQYPEYCPECGQLLHDDEIEPHADKVAVEAGQHTYRFNLTLGDWSMDGHGIDVPYSVISSVPLEQVREAHFRIKEVCGVNIEEMFEEKDYLTFFELQILQDLGWKQSFAHPLFDGKMFVEADDVVDLWIFLLKKADPTIQTLEVSEDNMEDIHFGGVDKKGRHIGTVGYGLWP